MITNIMLSLLKFLHSIHSIMTSIPIFEDNI